MYQLSNFIEYQGNEYKVKMGNHLVLAWGEKSGYYFTQFGFCVGDVKIIGIENV